MISNSERNYKELAYTLHVLDVLRTTMFIVLIVLRRGNFYPFLVVSSGAPYTLIFIWFEELFSISKKNVWESLLPNHSHVEARHSLQYTMRSIKFLHITCKPLPVKQKIFLPLKNKEKKFFLLLVLFFLFLRQFQAWVYRIQRFFFSFKKRLDRVKGRGSSMATNSTHFPN